MAKIVVTSGLYVVPAMVTNEEGESWLGSARYHGVSFSTPYGMEYNHTHMFPDSPEGQLAAERLAARVQAKLDATGVDSLDGAHWATRIIYGSEAYSDNEPEIVQREKDDALLFEAFGG